VSYPFHEAERHPLLGHVRTCDARPRPGGSRGSAGNAAGVRWITIHDARRTCGSLLADLDVHPRVAMQILGTPQFTITMQIYTQISSTQTRDALKRLAESLESWAAAVLCCCTCCSGARQDPGDRL
jgi:integrase